MFKIAFPWAKVDEERAERDYLKSRRETSQDDVAGNVWISPLLGTYPFGGGTSIP
jgi:hemolysin-activating ACP:hemolysin acyltransferase